MIDFVIEQNRPIQEDYLGPEPPAASNYFVSATKEFRQPSSSEPPDFL